MRFKKKILLTSIAIAALQSTSVFSAQNTMNTYKSQNYSGQSQSFQIANEGLLLGDPRVFEEDGDFILSTDEWSDIQFFAQTAYGLPHTEQSMKQQFELGDLPFKGLYPKLLSNYQDIHNISLEWLGSGGYRDQMVKMAHDLKNYSVKVNSKSNSLSMLAELMFDAAEDDNQEKFERYKSAFKKQLIKISNETNDFFDTAGLLNKKLDNYVLDLENAEIDLDQLEDEYQDELGNNGDLLRSEVARLILEVEALNKKYVKWKNVSWTTLTYAWIPPWGTIAAITCAARCSQEAIAFKKELDDKRQELADKEQELDTQLKVYASWEHATGNMHNIKSAMGPARHALQKLQSGWHDITNTLDSTIKTIDGIDTDDVLNQSDNWDAAWLTQTEVEAVQALWGEVGSVANKWAANAYLTEAPAEKINFN
ncbi:alpha-xenorhabdolysin family binary toxin subunit A [Vibrio splendidus]|uniref:alpha-xenorhabdolysin family binary toxin subunit A n=1 Tax=Vibrio splendidus TaxID=29497 RepID=UPI00021C3F77|nr:alpha-xenorhabdolysin family binary toxin subunit A [Vibrio splendidus]EGU41475.1 hypothetical protein VISP3789_13300 [Vibrio splendidus ATCC 33789]